MSQCDVPEPFSSIIEDACEDDRIWFEENPSEEYRIRPARPGEFYPLEITPKMVHVKRIAPGVRVREPYDSLAVN